MKLLLAMLSFGLLLSLVHSDNSKGHRDLAETKEINATPQCEDIGVSRFDVPFCRRYWEVLGGYFSSSLNIKPAIRDLTFWQECARRCSDHPKCKYWSFGHDEGNPEMICHLKTGNDCWIKDENWHSGNKVCGDMSVCNWITGGYYSKNYNINPPLIGLGWRDCAERCNEHPKCEFWSVGDSRFFNSTCYLKTAAVGWTSVDWPSMWQSGSKACGGENCNQKDGGYYSLAYNMKKTKTRFWEDCAKLCFIYPKCRFLSYAHGQGTCHLLTAAVGWTKDKNWSSGSKACGGCQRKTGNYYLGWSDIHKTETTTSQECANRCFEYGGCNYWSFGPTGTCNLKSSAGSFLNMDGWQSGNKACGAPRKGSQ